jgi:hypothetical protein
MSVELVGFENLPNAFIKDVIITKVDSRQNALEVTVRVHDLPDRSIWSSTEEIFYQLMKVGLIISTNTEETNSLTSGEMPPTSVEHMTKSLMVSPQITEENSYFELKFRKNIATNTPNATVFAFCYISRDDVVSSFGVTLQKDFTGPVKSEKIFQSLRVVSSTNVFVRADGTYWSGPVHEHNGVFMEGSYHTNIPHKQLTRLSVNNTKIKDRREVTEVAHGKVSIVDTLISNLFVSYSSQTDINCLFMINIKALLMKHTKYGAFLRNSSQEIVDSLLNQMNFRMISIQRQRIKASFRGAGLRSTKRRADKVFSKKNILNTQDDANRRVLKKMRLEREGALDALPGEIENISDYKKIADIEELFFDYGSEIRTFQFTDYEMTSKTPGDYQYKIELHFVDPVDKFLRNTLILMKTDVAVLTNYLNIFARRGTPTDIDIQQVVKNYVDHYSYIYQLNSSEKTDLAFKYTNLISPTTTDVHSISNFVSKYRDLYKDFLTFIGYDDQKINNTLLSIKAKDSMSSRIVIDKVFEEIVSPSDNALSFLYLPEKTNKKTAVYTKSTFFQLAQEEVEEQFIEEPNFSLPQIDKSVGTSISDTQTTKTAFFSAKEFNSGLKKSRVSNTTSGIATLNSSIFKNTARKSRTPQATFRGTMEPFMNITTQPISPALQDNEDGQFIETEEILGPNHEFVRYSEREDDYNRPSIQTKSQQKFNNALFGLTRNRTLTTTLEKIPEISAIEAQVLPNHLKAVVNGQSNATRSNFISNGSDLLSHPSTKNYYELKNFSVKEVVYIDRFERSVDGNLLLNKPVHKTLMLSEFTNLSKPALCFLKDYTNEKFNISGAEEVQVMNSVFVISDVDIAAPRDKVVFDPDPIYSTQEVEYQFMNSNIVKQTNTAISSPISSPQTTDSSTTTRNNRVVQDNRMLRGY